MPQPATQGCQRPRRGARGVRRRGRRGTVAPVAGTSGGRVAIVVRVEAEVGTGRERALSWPVVFPALIVAMLGLLLTAFAVNDRAKQETTLAAEHATVVAAAEAAAVQARIQWLTGAIDNLASVISDLGEPTEEQFRAITAGIFAREPSLQAVQYARLVTDDERGLFEAELAARGLPATVVEPQDGVLVPAGQRPEYVVVTLNEPGAANRSVYGLDITARPTNRETVAAARDAGMVQVGGSTVIVQGGGEISAIHLYAPVFQPGFDASGADVAERRANFVGSTGAVLRYREMIDSADVGDDPRVEEALLDVTDSGAAIALWQSGGASGVPVDELATWPIKVPVMTDGRSLLMVARAAPGRSQGLNFFSPIAVGIIGVLATVVLTVVVYKWMDARRLTRLMRQLSVATDRLQYLADRDALTGLPHRERLREWAAHRLTSNPDCSLVVMFVDLDGFRDVNSTMGHPVGDSVLVEVAHRLTHVTPAHTGLVSHVGADEFVVLACPADGQSAEPLADELAQQVVAVIARPIEVADREILLTASVGTAVRPRDGDSLEQLLAHADAAVREAKRTEPGTVRRFTPAMADSLRRRQQLSDDLRRAVRAPDEQFHLVYQAQVDMVSGAVVGAEALLRWNHPQLGPVSPAEFIPIAEETGLIRTLGRWVVQSAVEQMRHWDAEGMGLPALAVNVAPQQLRDPDFPAVVRDLVVGSGIDCRRIEFEVTESTAMDPEGESQLAALADLGFRIAVDDFGSGYSSMARLGQFPAERLKIDRAFVARMMESEQSLEVVRAIVALAAALGLEVVAEGVETAQQAQALVRDGVRIGQGYLFARPLPGAQFAGVASVWATR